jgi:alanine racemase
MKQESQTNSAVEICRPERPAWIEISRSALQNNVQQIRAVIGPDVEMMAVVKANAYGHGATDVAPIIAGDVDRFAVAALSEAIDLRRTGIEQPILVLGYTPGWLAHDAARLGVTLTVYDIENAREFNVVAAQMGRDLCVHLKVNTGMNRLGVEPADVMSTLSALQELEHLGVEGIYTHFASADLTDKQHTEEQFALFASLLEELKQANLRPRLAHAANSAATISLPGTHLQMVRTGIVLYGLDPDVEETPAPAGCVPVLTWKANVAQVRKLAAGAGVSYGHEFVADRPMTVAVIPVGYADGFPRKPLHWGSVLIHGREAPILGRVCMDQSIVDVTAIVAETAPVTLGDEVVIIGRQGDAELSAAEAGRRTGTINYDVTSRILARVPRIVVP